MITVLLLLILIMIIIIIVRVRTVLRHVGPRLDGDALVGLAMALRVVARDGQHIGERRHAAEGPAALILALHGAQQAVQPEEAPVLAGRRRPRGLPPQPPARGARHGRQAPADGDGEVPPSGEAPARHRAAEGRRRSPHRHGAAPQVTGARSARMPSLKLSLPEQRRPSKYYYYE